MTLEELQAAFDLEDDFLKFEEVENPRSKRPDLHAFLLLDELVPGDSDMVAAAEHDQIYLDADAEKLAAVVSLDQIRELRRCGVMFDSETDGLSMFA